MIKFSKKTDLSVIILNYNSDKYLSGCLASIWQSQMGDYKAEVIVVDNNSTDSSFTDLETAAQSNTYTHPSLTLKTLHLPQNIGFAAGNNRGLTVTDPNSQYVLFLNPDTTVQGDTFSKMLAFFAQNPKVDAATCHVTLALTGQLQPESHRGFPVPWNTFWHFFGFGIPKLFPKSTLLHGYLMDHLDYTKVQKIDCCVGAFFMMKRSVGQSVGWWNEKYFFYGEDLDFCYKLRQKGYSLYFYPGTKIIHYQGVASGLIDKSKKISTASRATKIRSARESTRAMKIFVSENLVSQYPLPLQWLVLAGINLLAAKRYVKARFF